MPGTVDMSVNRNHWGAKPYQLAFVTTVLVAWAKAKVDPYSSFSARLDLDIETKLGVCYTSHGTLAVRGNDKAWKRYDILLISSRLILPVCYAV
jgi:hypothetical protein